MSGEILGSIDRVFVRNRRPYYIYAPPYTRLSAGIRVMHLLCHYLNKMGEDAYVCTDVVMPGLRTPVLTDSIKNAHRDLSLDPIAVYPEVVHGNPLNVGCVVRYILNHVGLLGGPVDFPDTDLRVFYIEEYLSTGFDVSSSLFMTVPVFDFSVFNNIDNEFDDKRSGILVYPGRYKDAKNNHPKLFRDATVITYDWPSSPQEMAAILRKSKVLYSFANSAIVGEAVYCGCPVVMMDSPFTRRPENYFDKKSVGGHVSLPGVTFLDDEGAIAEARRKTAELYGMHLADDEKFIDQLTVFVEKTQSMPVVRSLDRAEWGVPEWIVDRTPRAGRVLALQTMLDANPDAGTLGAVVRVSDANDLQALAETLDSLEVQVRPLNSVWLVGEGVVPPAGREGIKVLKWSGSWHQVLTDKVEQEGAPDFLWLLNAGDRLLPQASLLFGEYRLRNPDPLVWYTDEAVLKNAEPTNPMLKPDFNIDLLRSYPYIGWNLIVSTAAIHAAGGFDDHFAGLASIDLLWRLVEKAGPPVVGHIPEVLQFSGRGLMDWVRDPETLPWFQAVTQAHFARMGLDAQIESSGSPGFQRIAYPLREQPLVSIIIPTRDQLPVLQACVEGLMEHTAYSRYELLIVDNDSKELDAVAFLNGLEGMKTDQIRVLRWPQPFDFAAMNNYAVSQSRGELLLFLNNDIQFSARTRPDWLERLLRLLLRPEVGMVGTRLDLLDGRVDQYGQVPGLDNSVGSAFRGESASKQGYMYRLVVQQNASALSASCLMVRRSVFQELGGFDAQAFPVYYADTDLSLKAVQAGYLLALEPETGLLHMGGATRLLTEKFGLKARPDDDQRDRLYGRWLPQLASDPYYHPAFDKSAPGFSLSQDAARIYSPLPGRPLPVVLASHSDWHGCGHYRILHPFEALSGELRTEGGVKYRDFHFTDVARIQPDVIVLQGAWLNEGILTQIRRYREITGAKVVLEFDDYLPNIPTRSAYRKTFQQSWIKQMRRAIEQVDWLVVSTSVLAREYADFHDDIRVAQNGLLPDWWGTLQGRRRAGRKMRVGWAGGSSHTGDLAEIRAVVNDLQDDVEWVFMGSKPNGVSCEFHAGVPIEQYPAKLASLNLDLAVVPLEMNQFNRSKSNLRLLELGACGVPVICTDIDPYQGTLPVTRVRNRPQDWVRAIREHLADPAALARQGDTLRDVVLSEWMLEGGFLDQWVAAWGVASAVESNRPLGKGW